MAFDPASAVAVAPDAPAKATGFDPNEAEPVAAEETNQKHIGGAGGNWGTPDFIPQARARTNPGEMVAKTSLAEPIVNLPRIDASTPIGGAIVFQHPIEAGVYNAAAPLISSFTSPANIALLVTTGGLGNAALKGSQAANLALKGIAAYFAGSMADDALKQTQEAKKAITKDSSIAEDVESVAKPVLTGAMAVFAGLGALHDIRPDLTPTLAKEQPLKAAEILRQEAEKAPAEQKPILEKAAEELTKAKEQAPNFDAATAKPVTEVAEERTNADQIESPTPEVRGNAEPAPPSGQVAEGITGQPEEPAGARSQAQEEASPPVTPEQHAKDYSDYQQIQAEWKAELEKGEIDMSSPKMQELWRRNEEIKNRYDGFPPPEPVAVEPTKFNAAEAEPVSREPGFVTGIKNAIVDQERQARGQEPVLSQARLSNPEAWDEGMKRVEANPSLPDQLMNEMIIKPRPLDPVETSILIQEKVTRQNEFETAVDHLTQAREKDDEAAVNAARMRVRDAEAKLNKIDEVARKEGSLAGASLQARKILAADDYSVASLAAQKIAAKGGEKLTDAELVEIKKTSDSLKANAEALESQEKKWAEAPTTDLQSPQARSLVSRILDVLDRQAAEAEKRLFSGRLNTISPQVLYDLSVIAARDIAHGAVDFTKWSAEKLEKFGEKVRPHLEEAWKRGNEMLDQQVEKLGGKKRRKTSGSGRLGAYKTRLQNEIRSLQERIEAGNFAKLPRKPLELDPEAMKLREQREALIQKFKEGIERDKEANLSKAEKATNALVKWRRIVVLSSVRVFPKLIEAGLLRVLVNPVSRLLGQPLRLIPGLTEKAPYELGLSAKSEAANIAAIITSPPKMLQKLLKGKTDIDLKAGQKPRTQEMFSFVGNAHGAIKEPVRQGAFAQSVALRLQELDKAGVDIREPDVQTMVISAAVADANRQIFMQDNMVTKYLVRLPLRALENQGKGGKALANTMKFLMPIVNVPTNIALHQMRLIPPIGFGEAALRIVQAAERGELKNRAAKLTEEEARNISIAFKAGMIGTALAAYAWLHPEDFGGTYDQKVKNPKLKPGDIKIFGETIPHWMNHAPELNFLNVVASSRRVFDRYYKTEPGDTTAELLAFSTFAPVKDLPFVSEWLRLFGTHKSPGSVAGELVRDATIPSAVTSTLDLLDDKQRKPKTFSDQIKMAVPGLREEVKGVRKQEHK